MFIPSYRAAILFSVLAVVACQPQTAGQRQNPGPTVSTIVVDALGDVPCQVVVASTTEDRTDYNILCRGWERPVGQARRIQLTAAESRIAADDVLKLFQGLSESFGVLSSGSSCENDRQRYTLSTGVEALASFCVTEEDQFPFVALAAKLDSAVFLGWGPNHLVPVFEAMATGSPELQQQSVGIQSALLIEAKSELDQRGFTLGLEDMGSIRSLSNLIDLQIESGDSVGAIDNINRLLEIYERAGEANSAGTGHYWAYLANQLRALGRFAEATSALDRAETLSLDAASDDLSYRIDLYEARLYAAQGQTESAFAKAEESLAGRLRTANAQGHRFWRPAQSSRILGDIYFQTGDNSQALANFNKALDLTLRDSRQERPAVASAEYRIARALVELGDTVGARPHIDRATQIVQDYFGESPFAAYMLAISATIASQDGDWDTAWSLFQETLAMVNSDPVINERATFLSVSPELRDLVGIAIPILFEEAGRRPAMQQEILAVAFEVAQRAQTIEAARAVAQTSARVASGDSELQSLVRDLQNSVNARRQARFVLGTMLNPPEGAAVPERDIAAQTERVRLAASRIDAVEAALQSRFPEYGSITFGAQLTAADAATFLRPGEVLLVTLPWDNATWSFLLSGDGQLRTHTSALSKTEIAAGVAALRRAFRPRAGRLPEFDMAASNRFYNDLFGDLADEIKSADVVHFVGSGALLSFPLSVLVTAPANDYRDARWLVQDVAVGTLPAVRSLADLRRNAETERAVPSYLGVGAPPLQGADNAELYSDTVACERSDDASAAIASALAPLPAAAEELRDTARLIGGGAEVLTGAGATEAGVRDRDLSQVSILHFATHAVLPFELGCLAEPALVLSPTDGGSHGDDGLLTASEVAGLELNADFVVLSACNTAGPGQQFGGEALSGLAASFFFAGANSVLATHWEIEDEAAKQIATTTIANYASDDAAARAVALQAAQVELLGTARYSHPFFWGAYSLIGA